MIWNRVRQSQGAGGITRSVNRPIEAMIFTGLFRPTIIPRVMGLLIERWPLFAEAEHVVMLYYGADAA
jgi:hypothetical protein